MPFAELAVARRTDWQRVFSVSLRVDDIVDDDDEGKEALEKTTVASGRSSKSVTRASWRG
jgi:hypothetical protein